MPGRPETVPQAPVSLNQPAPVKAAKKARKAKEFAPLMTPAEANMLEGPALPISAEKHQRLQQLLQKYQADEVTPEQYHQQRAKILAEP